MTFLKEFASQTRSLARYGLLMAVLIFALKWFEWKFFILHTDLTIYVGLLSVFFTLLGIWGARQFSIPRVETILVEKEVYINRSENFVIDQEEFNKLDLTSREYEVLQGMVKGCSNAEIAEQLFLSLSTVKTHASSLFVKMEVKSRTQAIEKSKRLKIVA